MIRNELPTPLLILIFEFTAHPYLQSLRGVSRGFREVLDDRNNATWNSIMKSHCTPTVAHRLLWGGSLGTTALMVRASVVHRACISCRLWFNLDRNEFYDLVVCRRCAKKTAFKVVNLNKSCFNYFLDYKTQQENSDLVKHRKGRSFLVLLTHVRAVASAKYPGEELQQKINARFARAFKMELRQQQERGKRIQEISFKFIDVLWQTPSRVDVVLRDQEVLKDLVQHFGSRREVFGDTMEKRVRASTKTNVVAQRLYDYAAMLTYMRKLGLLDFRYDVTDGHRCNPNYVYRHHVNEGLHFYELSRQHADGKNEISKRTSDVETYLVQRVLTTSERKTLAVALCAEEAINYTSSDFHGFVVHRQGNPVTVARRVREREFLTQNHLAWETNHFLVEGYSQEEATALATNNVLHRTKGFPPMMRTCFIHLSTPSRVHAPGTSSLLPPET